MAAEGTPASLTQTSSDGEARAHGEQPPDWTVVAPILTLAAMYPVSMDCYAPCLPVMTRAIGGGSAALMQATISVQMATAAAMTVPFGVYADLYGRARVLTAGSAGFLLVAVWCPLVTSASQLLALRVAMGVCNAATMGTAAAAVRDLLPTPAARRRAVGSLIAVRQSAHLVSPAAGGLVLSALGWRWALAILPLVGAIAVVAAWRLAPGLRAAAAARAAAARADAPEPHAKAPETARSACARAAGALCRVLGAPSFLTYMAAEAPAFASLPVLVTGASHVLQTHYSVPVRMYVGIMASISLTTITGARLSALVARRAPGGELSVLRLALGTGWVAQALALALAIWPASVPGAPPWLPFVALNLLTQLGRGMGTHVVQSFGVEHFPREPSSANSTMQMTRALAGASAVYAIGALYDCGTWPVGAPGPFAGTMLVLFTLSCGGLEVGLRAQAQRDHGGHSTARVPIAPAPAATANVATQLH